MNERIICELSPKDFDPNDSKGDISTYHERRAARGILKRGNTLGMIHITNFKYHKLPGGGIEGDETPEQGFVREVLEETGSKCNILDRGGITVEYRKPSQQLQTSYVFYAEVVGEPGEVSFEQDELDEGAVLEWIPISDAYQIMSEENPEEFDGNYIHKRDKAILDFYRDKLI